MVYKSVYRCVRSHVGSGQSRENRKKKIFSAIAGKAQTTGFKYS